MSGLTDEQKDTLFDLIRTLSLTDYIEIKRRILDELGLNFSIEGAEEIFDDNYRLAGDPGEPCLPYRIILADAGPSRLQVIKTIREMMNLDPQKAQRFVNEAPTLLTGVYEADEAIEWSEKFHALGAKIEIRKVNC